MLRFSRKIAGCYNVKKIFSDPDNAERLPVDLREKHGLPVEFLAQGWRNLSDATETVQELVLSGRLRHGGHKILRWNVANAVAKMDANGNLRLDKAKSRMKIDGASALVNAVKAAIDGDFGSSVYETRGVLTI